MKDNKIEKHPFEYIFKINGNIICQRYFNIRNFNEDVIDSLEMKELLESIGGMDNNQGFTMGIIPSFLKDRSAEYLTHFDENPRLSFEDKDEDKNIWDKNDNYSFEIKINGDIVGIIRFAGNTFPPKIRYKVNLKHKTNIWGDKELDNGSPIHLDILPRITKEIKKTFSRKTYTKEYMGYSLDYLTKQRSEYTNKFKTLYN